MILESIKEYPGNTQKPLEMLLSVHGCTWVIGAKHYHPGDRGPPDWSKGVPPVCVGDIPLIHVISGICGAKHSHPGDRGVPDWSRGVPPVCAPEPPFIHDISGSC